MHEQEPPPPDRGSVLRSEQFSLAEAVGGWRGALESVLPTLLFVVLFVATRSLRLAAGAAVGVVLLAVLARLVQRQPLGSALGGLIGVGVGAIWALRSGQGTDFYAPGLAINAITFVIVVASILAQRPLAAIIAALADPRVAQWSRSTDARRTYTRASWLLAGLYAAKLAVQGPLYAMGQVALLGVAKIVMGLPLFALVVWLIWLMHRALVHRLAARGEDLGRTPSAA